MKFKFFLPIDRLFNLAVKNSLFSLMRCGICVENRNCSQIVVL